MMTLIPGPSGKPMMSLSDFLPTQETFRPIISFLEKSGIDARFINALLPESKKLTYRWKDRDGNWQISEVVPEYAKDSAVLQSEDGDSLFGGGHSATVIYQWKDEKGRMQFSEYHLVPDYAKATAKKSVISTSDVNTVNMPKPSDSDEENSKDNGQSMTMPFPTTIDPSKIKDLVKDAKNVENLLEERNKQMENY